LLVGEPFTRFDALRLPNASISAVNLSEVLARLQEIGMPEAEIDIALARLNLQVLAFDAPQARATARLHSVTRHAGLSLGDRACLALGGILGCPVVTADRVWASVNVGVEVIVIQ
jgi:PIN domain nuclease of toxin-antitoxin system